MNRLIFRGVVAVFVLFASFCVPSIASADGVVSWDLSATFNDGGTASGSFAYDAVTNAFSAIDITTSSTSAFGGATYTSLSGVFGSSNTGMALGSSGDLTNTPIMLLFFGTPLSNLGGTVSLLTGPIDGGVEGTCNNLDCTDSTAFRFITSGEVVGAVATPEPSALLLVSSGLVALLAGLAIRRISQV